MIFTCVWIPIPVGIINGFTFLVLTINILKEKLLLLTLKILQKKIRYTMLA